MALHDESQHTSRTNYTDFVNTIQDYENDDDSFGHQRASIAQTATSTATSYETDSSEDDDEDEYEEGDEMYEEVTNSEYETDGEEISDEDEEEDGEEYEEEDGEEYEEEDGEEYEEEDSSPDDEMDNEDEFGGADEFEDEDDFEDESERIEELDEDSDEDLEENYDEDLEEVSDEDLEEDSDEDLEEDSDEDLEEESGEDDDSGSDGSSADDADELNTFAMGSTFDGVDSESNEEDEFDDENQGFNPYATPRPSTGRNAISQREQLVRDREKHVNMREKRTSRWLLALVALVCCGAAAVMIIYFLGVGPFEDDPPTVQTKPTDAPILDGGNATETLAPSFLSSTSPTDAPVLPGFPVNPKYQVVVPSGIGNGVTMESLGTDLIALMNMLAPAILTEYISTAKRRLRGSVARQLQQNFIIVPTSIISISVDDCPVLAGVNSLCVEVLADVALVSENSSEVLEGYRVALLTALEDGRLEDFADDIGTDTVILVTYVESGIMTQVPSDVSNSTAAPTMSPTVALSVAPVETDAPIGETMPPVATPAPTNATDTPTASPTNSTMAPTNATDAPTASPTNSTDSTMPPANATDAPTASPTNSTLAPTNATDSETIAPTVAPTNVTGELTMAPTVEPGDNVTDLPTDAPDTNLTVAPTVAPTTMVTMAPTVTPVRYFVIAGDTNVVGFADLNHLVTLSFSDQSYRRFVTSNFSPVRRDDAFVSFDKAYGDPQNVEEGALSSEYGSDGAHFGPEVGFGFDLADEYDEDVVIVKGGGRGALAVQWLPPSSSTDGNPGEYYQFLLDDIRDAMSRVDGITGSAGPSGRCAGVVWLHGYDDYQNADYLGGYENNLQNLIDDLRMDLNEPELPFVIAELGAQGNAASADELEMREIQQRVVNANNFTIFSNTSQFITVFDTTSDTQTYDTQNQYWGRADTMVSIGSQLATDMLEVRGEAPIIV